MSEHSFEWILSTKRIIQFLKIRSRIDYALYNIAECFSLGVPVVSTSIGNAGDLVSKSNAGTLFDFEVKGSFRKALDAVYEQRTKFSFNAYNYYLCNQTPASNYERLNKIYDTL